MSLLVIRCRLFFINSQVHWTIYVLLPSAYLSAPTNIALISSIFPFNFISIVYNSPLFFKAIKIAF
nr:MAG TPA: hypothetical protein [Caudoviricetes sp.]